MKPETLQKIRDAITLYAADAPAVLKELDVALRELGSAGGVSGLVYVRSSSKTHVARVIDNLTLCGYRVGDWPVVVPDVSTKAGRIAWARRKKCADCTVAHVALLSAELVETRS